LKGELRFIKSFLEFQAGSTNDQRLTKLSTLRSSFNNIKVSQLFLDFARVPTFYYYEYFDNNFSWNNIESIEEWKLIRSNRDNFEKQN
jgi:hypothetical protein